MAGRGQREESRLDVICITRGKGALNGDQKRFTAETRSAPSLLNAPAPDAFAAEFADRFADGGAAFSVPLKDTHEGFRGFEIYDPDGYVLFFGRPG